MPPAGTQVEVQLIDIMRFDGAGLAPLLELLAAPFRARVISQLP